MTIQITKDDIKGNIKQVANEYAVNVNGIEIKFDIDAFTEIENFIYPKP